MDGFLVSLKFEAPKLFFTFRTFSLPLDHEEKVKEAEQKVGENLSPDRGEMAGCAGESTPMMSVSSSITVDDSSDVFLHRNASAGRDLRPEWTDEKHSLFLESLEVSFVKKLHDSVALHGWRSRGKMRGPYSSLNLSAHTYSSSDKNGYWQNIDLKRKEILSDSAVDSHCIKEIPWNRHFKSPSKCHTTASSDLQEISLHCSEGTRIRGKLSVSKRSLELHSEYELCRQYTADNIIEFSDQNFVDEGRKKNSGLLFEVKRRKTINATDASNNDQVVSFGKFKTAHMFQSLVKPLHTEEKVHQESLLVPEHPQIFIHPTSLLLDFFKGLVEINVIWKLNRGSL